MQQASLQKGLELIHPLVSIVMPSLNQIAFLPAAVQSVLTQSYRHIELIVVDGGSVDGSQAWLAQQRALDSRVQWTSESDSGSVSALNKALGRARGTIIGWLNADDVYTPDAVQRAVEALLEHRGWLLVHGHSDQTGNVSRMCASTMFFRRTLYVMLGPLGEALKSSGEHGARANYGLKIAQQMPQRLGFVDAVQAICSEPSKQWAQAVSLGSFCHAAKVLQQLELRAFSGPFDWIFSTPEVVAHMLADDFKIFLDAEQFEPVPPELRMDPHSNKCEHRFYRERFGLRFMFNHHSPDQPEDLAFFQRGVARFRLALAAPEPCLLLMVAQEPFHEERYRLVTAALDARGVDYFLIALNFVVTPVVNEALERVRVLVSSARFVALEMAVSARSDGVVFADTLDTAQLEQLIRAFNVRTHPRRVAA
jgi:glycosyltransferase involved in cell wall biosynthesis